MAETGRRRVKSGMAKASRVIAPAEFREKKQTASSLHLCPIGSWIVFPQCDTVNVHYLYASFDLLKSNILRSYSTVVLRSAKFDGLYNLTPKNDGCQHKREGNNVDRET